MLVKMNGEKGSTVVENLPEVTVQPESTKSSSTKKYLLIAASILFIIAIVLAAILVGLYFYVQSVHETLQYSVAFSNGDEQQVSRDMTDNIVSYHSGSGVEETWVINDFKRELQLTKVMVNNVYQCYILPLNRSQPPCPQTYNSRQRR